ncbi:UNVERIFIED_CONTAM: hypothetical protein Sindi_2289500 [Sesamum indicum]
MWCAQISTPCPEDVRIKREKLNVHEASSILKEEGGGNWALHFLKGLLAPRDRVVLEPLPRDQAMNSLASYVSKAALKLHDYPSTKEGKQMFKELWVSRMVDFKKSEEFQSLLIDNALKFYYHRYRTCTSQFADAGYLPLIAPIANVPQLGEEIPLELPENLLHVPQEGEAPTDLDYLMVENVVSFKVVPLADDDAPPTPSGK